jgi:hypothetical protein
VEGTGRAEGHAFSGCKESASNTRVRAGVAGRMGAGGGAEEVVVEAELGAELEAEEEEEAEGSNKAAKEGRAELAKEPRFMAKPSGCISAVPVMSAAALVLVLGRGVEGTAEAEAEAEGKRSGTVRATNTNGECQFRYSQISAVRVRWGKRAGGGGGEAGRKGAEEEEGGGGGGIIKLRCSADTCNSKKAAGSDARSAVSCWGKRKGPANGVGP